MTRNAFDRLSGDPGFQSLFKSARHREVPKNKVVLAESQAQARPEGRLETITRQDLGKLAGCSRELAGMVVKEFAKAGRLELRGKTILIPTLSGPEQAIA